MTECFLPRSRGGRSGQDWCLNGGGEVVESGAARASPLPEGEICSTKQVLLNRT